MAPLEKVNSTEKGLAGKKATEIRQNINIRFIFSKESPYSSFN
jgi:hypothetical protein